MSTVSPARVLRACLYIHGLEVRSREFQVGRALLLMPYTGWAGFLTRMVASFPSEAPERDTAEALLRIVVGEQETAA